MSPLQIIAAGREEFVAALAAHGLLVVASTLAACVVGVPVGIALSRRPGLSRPVLGVANVLQTIPSLALFGFLMPVLGSHGIGPVPAVIALFLYALLPIVRNTFTGIAGVDPAVREAGRGMGMTDLQLLARVELPLGLPVLLAGVRIATVISIGTATIAAAIGAGGLGTYIFRGLRMNDTSLVLVGAVPSALLAMVADGLLGWLERSLAPGPRRRSAAGRWRLAAVGVGLLALGLGAARWAASTPRASVVVVGSKDFTEQVLLGELTAQVIESSTPLTVERRFELGGDLAHRALVEGSIDVYVEYTGTALMAVLKQPPATEPRAVFALVEREYAARFDVSWLPPLGFDDTFAILVRGEASRRDHLGAISDLIPLAGHLRAAFGQDFLSRPDGYAGLVRAYDLRFAEPPREMDLSLTYRALAAGQVDVIAGNSTDGLIDVLDLVRLQDDRRYFPPYEAAPVVRNATLARHPELRAALAKLSGKLTEGAMRRLNQAVDGDHRSPRDVAREFLAQLPPLPHP